MCSQFLFESLVLAALYVWCQLNKDVQKVQLLVRYAVQGGLSAVGSRRLSASCSPESALFHSQTK